MVAAPVKEVPQVLNEIRAHGGVKLSAVGKQFPSRRGNGTVNTATIWRWARNGVLTPDGRRVRLEVVKVGMSFITSQAAVDRFLIALTEASITPDAEQPAAKPVESKKRGAAASKRLQSLGA